MILQAPDWLVAVKLALILVFLAFTGPTSTYALAHTAITSNIRPMLATANTVIAMNSRTTMSAMCSILGLKAAQAGYRVLFTSAVEAVTQLLKAEENGDLAQTLTRLARPAENLTPATESAVGS